MSMPIDFDLFREVSLIHQKHADWEAITTLSIDDPSYDTYAAGFKTAVGVIEQYITNLQAANSGLGIPVCGGALCGAYDHYPLCGHAQIEPEQAQTAVGLPERFCETMPTGRGTYEETDELNIYVKCGTLLYTADQMESYATAKTAEAVQNALEEAAMLFNQKHQEYFGSDIQDAIRSMTKYAPSNGKA